MPGTGLVGHVPAKQDQSVAILVFAQCAEVQPVEPVDGRLAQPGITFMGRTLSYDALRQGPHSRHSSAFISGLLQRQSPLAHTAAWLWSVVGSGAAVCGSG